MTTHTFACLVHERPDVVADLVANLRAFEPDATILLYDGSRTGDLLGSHLSVDDHVRIHPTPQPMRWGRLHDFAVDSMRFALQELDFDALTIVDSDQLMIRTGYAERVAGFLKGHPTVGMLGNAPDVQPRTSTVDPVRVAWREPGLWQLFLDRLPGGMAAFPHWTFWPSTVFTRRAAADLVAAFGDRELQAILRRTRMFATEEVVLPTLVAALGHEIAQHPASYEYVRYRVRHEVADVERALADPDAYWMHPVPRRMDDPVRACIRDLAPPRRKPKRGAAPAPAGSARLLDLSAINSDLDPDALRLLAGVLTEVVAARPAYRARSISATDPQSPIAHIARDILAGVGDATPISSIAAQSIDSIDVAVLDDRRGLIELVTSLDAAIARARPGGVVYVSGRAIPTPKVAAVLSAAAAGTSMAVREAGGAFALALPKDTPPAGAMAPLADLRALVERSVGIDGWFDADEAVLLAVTAASGLRTVGSPTVVELGSFCGRATTVLGGVARQIGVASVYAVDRFDGVVGEFGRAYSCGQTLDRFRAAINGAGLAQTVNQVVGTPSEVEWSRPIGVLLVDGLHDYGSVAADFRHYAPWLDPAAFVAFHDYGTYGGVTRFVDELLRSGAFVEIARLRSLIVVRPQAARTPTPAPAHVHSDGLDGAATMRRAPIQRTPSIEAPVEAASAWQPLVSCLMPTFNRRLHVPGAIARFVAQDYPNRELLVVDDGSDPVADLIPEDARIRYIRVPTRMTIGAKRNLAAELATGEILANWDDDDWVASWRLSYEVGALLQSEADVVGLNRLLYYEPTSGRAWRYVYPRTDAPWVHDPTLCLRRATWESDRFPDANYSLDTTYLTRGRRKRVTPLGDERFYVGMIHPGNTSRKDTRGGRWRPTQADEVVAMMAADEVRAAPEASPRAFPN